MNAPLQCYNGKNIFKMPVKPERRRTATPDAAYGPIPRLPRGSVNLKFNTMETLINVFGYAATICLICGYLPQAIHTMRTHDTDGIALPTFLSMGVGSLFFIVQGALTGNIPLIISNVITTVCCIVITAIKLQNDRKKRRARA